MPTFNIPTEAKQTALTLANLIAPSGVEQVAFAKLMYELDSTLPPLTEAEILRLFLSAVVDGLAFGNWPK